MRFSSFTLTWKRVVPAFLMALVVGLCLGASPLWADDDEHDFGAALEAGEVMPMDRLLIRIRQDVGGRVLKVELERETDDDKPGRFFAPESGTHQK